VLDVKVTTIAIGAYLLLMTAAYLTGLGWLVMGTHPTQVTTGVLLCLKCAAVGGIGGCFYCLRGMYLNISVHKRWGDEWVAWYLIRPVVSAICGGISFVFLRAGLLVLDAGQRPDASDLGFFAVAFIAGLNVDRFVDKLEDVASSLWGIKKSRTAQGGDQPRQE
jgi:hypothetical protein